MKKQVFGVGVLVLLVVAAGAMLAYAQQVTANIPFEFRAGKKNLPAGTYIVTYGNADAKVLTLRNQSRGATCRVPIITRLAAKEPSNLEAHLVFDKVEDRHSLAEFWAPGMDGCYLGGALTTHSHVVIHAGK
jgi:hypothetical protein